MAWQRPLRENVLSGIGGVVGDIAACLIDGFALGLPCDPRSRGAPLAQAAGTGRKPRNHVGH